VAVQPSWVKECIHKNHCSLLIDLDGAKDKRTYITKTKNKQFTAKTDIKTLL